MCMADLDPKVKRYVLYEPVLWEVGVLNSTHIAVCPAATGGGIMGGDGEKGVQFQNLIFPRSRLGPENSN